MKSVSCIVLTTCIALSGVQVACVASSELDEDVSEAPQGLAVTNALTGNALTGNALTGNALTGNALTGNALTGNALTGNALTGNALQDPNAREVLRFIVGCALPAGTHFDITVNGVTYGYDGEIGLAPEWGELNGSCDESCQQWVSGCVLSRVNYLGQHVPISIRGKNKALGSTPSELSTYTHREATYYGNIFVQPQLRYACLSPGETEIPRVCGPSINGCIMDVVGSCDDACKHPKQDGYFPECSDHVRRNPGAFPRGTESYEGSVTVFLQP